MFSVDFNRQCTKCSIITNDIVIHWLCHCPANETCVNLLTLETEIEDDRMKNVDIAMRICKMY